MLEFGVNSDINKQHKLLVTIHLTPKSQLSIGNEMELDFQDSFQS